METSYTPNGLVEKIAFKALHLYNEKVRFLGALSTPDGLTKYKNQLQIPESELTRQLSILDIGSGVALEFPREVISMNPHMAGKITSLDPDFRYSRKKLTQLQHSGLNPIRGNVFNLKFPDNTFDRVYSCNAVSLYSDNFPDLKIKALMQMVRVTKIGGIIRLSPVDSETMNLYLKYVVNDPSLSLIPHDQFVHGQARPDEKFRSVEIRKLDFK